MKILVSGAGGSFGKELIKNMTKEEIDYETISLRYQNDFSQYQKTQLSNCDVFIHCGGLVDINGSFNELFESNSLLTKRILDFLNSNNNEVNFIYFSTMSLLKKKKNVFTDDFIDFSEMSNYAISKYISEIVSTRYNIPVTILRFSSLFYKDPTKDGLSKVVHDAVIRKKITIYDGGKAKRDFIPLDIAAKYVLKILSKDKLFGKKLNIVSGKETSFFDISRYLMNNINDLTILDEDSNLIDNLPSDFSLEYVKMIGEIKFDLFEKVGEFIEELSH